MDSSSDTPGPARWLEDAERIDVALYAAIAQTPTPALDRAMARLSRAADYSRLSLVSAAVLAATGGRRGRRAATMGLASLGVAASVVNLGVKPLGHRRRPDRAVEQVPVARHVRMPSSTSFPSGHSAAAFAFATGVGQVHPPAAIPPRALAALIADSRVHTGVHYPGVHYPGDVVAGALTGTALAQLTTHALDHRTTHRRSSLKHRTAPHRQRLTEPGVTGITRNERHARPPATCRRRRRATTSRHRAHARGNPSPCREAGTTARAARAASSPHR